MTLTDTEVVGSATSAPARPRRGRSWRRFKRDWPLVLMTLPCIGLLAVFHYLPMLGNVMAFEDYNPYADNGIAAFLTSDFVGLGQFRRLFEDPAFWRAMGNTLFFTGLQLVFFFPVPVIMALVLNSFRSYWVKAITQSVLYLPHFLSWVIVVAIFVRMLSSTGVVSHWLSGIGMDPLHLIGNPSSFPALILTQSVWKDAGWGVIIFLAALSGVDSSLHEAAAVDGAGRWRRLWHITLPAIRPVIILLLIMRLGDALSVGFEQFILQRDTVGAESAEVLDTYVYYTGVVSGDWSYGAAAGLFKGVVGLILILTANRVAHMIGEDGVYRKQS